MEFAACLVSLIPGGIGDVLGGSSLVPCGSTPQLYAGLELLEFEPISATVLRVAEFETKARRSVCVPPMSEPSPVLPKSNVTPRLSLRRKLLDHKGMRRELTIRSRHVWCLDNGRSWSPAVGGPRNAENDDFRNPRSEDNLRSRTLAECQRNLSLSASWHSRCFTERASTTSRLEMTSRTKRNENTSEKRELDYEKLLHRPVS